MFTLKCYICSDDYKCFYKYNNYNNIDNYNDIHNYLNMLYISGLIYWNINKFSSSH